MLIKRSKLKKPFSSEPGHNIDVNELSPMAHINQLQELPQSVQRPEIQLEASDEELVKAKIQELIDEQKQRLEAQELSAEEQISAKVKEAEVQAQEIVANAEKAKAEADEAIAKAKDELEQEKQAFQQTVEDEKKKAYNEGFKEGELLVQEFKKILGSFQNSKREILENAKKEIATIGVDVAKQIINHEVSQSSEILEKQISNSINKVVSGKGKVHIYVNPQDLGTAKDLKPAFSKALDPAIDLVFSKDERIVPGSCIIETKGGKFDANFSTQIETIKVAFKDYLNYEVEDLPNTDEVETMKSKKKIDEVEKEVLKEKKSTSKKTSSKSKSSSSGKAKATMKTKAAPSKTKKATSKAKEAPKKKAQNEVDEELEALLEDFEMPEADMEDQELLKGLEDTELDDDLSKLLGDAMAEEVKSSNDDLLEVDPEAEVDEFGQAITAEEKMIRSEDPVDYEDSLDDYKTRTYKDYEGSDFEEDDNEFQPEHFHENGKEGSEPTEDAHFRSDDDEYLFGEEPTEDDEDEQP